MNSSKARHEWISAKVSHTPLPSPPMCSVRSDIVFVYHHSGPTRRKETVLRYIFAKRLLKRKNRGSTRLWLIFNWTLKEEKTKLRKTYFRKRRKKFLILFCREKKKETCLKLFDLGGGRAEMNISASFSSFYSKKKKMSQRFRILVAPLLQRSVYFLCDGWQKRSMSRSHLIVSFSSLRMERDGGTAAQWYVPSSLLFSVFFSSIALSHHPFHILCGNVVFLLFVLFPVLVWNSPRFETFNEKNNTAGKETELCSVV